MGEEEREKLLRQFCISQSRPEKEVWGDRKDTFTPTRNQGKRHIDIVITYCKQL